MAVPGQSFTSRQLGWMRRWHSQAHLRTELGSRPTNSSEWASFLCLIEDQIAKDAFPFSGLRWHSVRRKRALSTNLLEDALVIRKINDNIRRSYGLTQANRTSLIRTAKQAIRENAPKTIIRIDLKSCFESICRNRLIKQLKVDAQISTQTSALLDALFVKASKKLGSSMLNGIPRGLTISTSLAEIKLRELDQRLRTLPGTYLVLRYVDDLLIFTTTGEKEAIKQIQAVVRATGFRINQSKADSVRVACLCELGCSHGASCPCKSSCSCIETGSPLKELEYLGYKLIFHKHNKKKEKPNEVDCVLSKRKTCRIKTRIKRALDDCKSTGDWVLLQHRIAYLTANQRVAATPGKRGLFNGLAYTHSEYSEPDGYTGVGTLRDLDIFYRSGLRRLVKATGTTPINLASLQAMTFESGFRHMRRTKFPALRVLQIKKCWEE